MIKNKYVIGIVALFVTIVSVILAPANADVKSNNNVCPLINVAGVTFVGTCEKTTTFDKIDTQRQDFAHEDPKDPC